MKTLLGLGAAVLSALAATAVLAGSGPADSVAPVPKPRSPAEGFADSASFALDTRSVPTNSGFADSSSFVLDTRPPGATTGYADSAPFVLDTRIIHAQWIIF